MEYLSWARGNTCLGQEGILVLGKMEYLSWARGNVSQASWNSLGQDGMYLRQDGNIFLGQDGMYLRQDGKIVLGQEGMYLRQDGLIVLGKAGHCSKARWNNSKNLGHDGIK